MTSTIILITGWQSNNPQSSTNIVQVPTLA
jgi:hypothetical protein